MKFVRVLLLSVCLIGGWISNAAAQSTRPIRFIVPYAAGGAVDVYARAVAGPMGKHLNRTIVIENFGGAGGNIGVARVAKAPPDGDTLLFHNMAMATNPSLYKELDHDPLKDFEYVGVVAHSVMAMVARRNLPANDLAQFIAYAKSQREKVNIGDGGIGGPTHLCALLFMSAIGTKFTSISYKGGAPAMNDLVAGQIDLLCDGTATAGPQITGGKVKALGVSSKARLPTLSTVPTLAEGGLAGFELTPWSGIYAPKSTPRPVLQQLEAALQSALADKALIANFEKLGIIPASREQASSAGLQAHLKAEVSKWSTLLKEAGVEPN